MNTCTWKVVGHLDPSIFFYPFQSGPHETLTQKPRGFDCRSRFRGANCGGFGWSRIFVWCHCLFLGHLVIWMCPKIVGFHRKSSILIGFSIIFTIHFGVPICLETPTVYWCKQKSVSCFLNFDEIVMKICGNLVLMSWRVQGTWISIWFGSTVVLLMVQKSQGQPPIGCIDRTPVNNGRFHLPFPSNDWGRGLQGGLPSWLAPRSGEGLWAG